MQAHPVFGGSDPTVPSFPFPLWHSARLGWPTGWSSMTQGLMSRLAACVGSRSRYHDPLTGLLNRVALEAHISALIATKSTPFAILVLGVDSSSHWHANAGWSVDDLLLKRVAARLQQRLPDPCAIARLRNNTLALLVHHSGRALAELIDRILGSFGTPFHISHQDVCLMARLGVAEAGLPGQTGSDYLKYAEAALEGTKQPGQGQCIYSTVAMTAALTERLQLEDDLRHALVAEELVVYYQPIVDGQTLKICGFEALVRWQHPQRGLISPAEFIPVAEQSGLILEMGWWVMAKACAQMRQWRQQFPDCRDFKISVNVSNQQFLHPDCTERINEILQRTGLPPQNLTLEITESAFIDHDENTQATLNWITDQHISLSIDDFGTGYSSLSYLYRFPVSTVKIDRSFIQAAALARNSGTIVEAIIALGHKLGLAVVAEGVETSEAVDWLQQQGCNQLQGFLFSRPLPASKVTLLLSELLSDPCQGNGPVPEA